ncbi:hypothetical protein, partial [Halorubrum sp. Atlit-28R]|uniref:hypothetical protein n=1 Tax=Halorubrum sp. Atlit-28R TaxID=2282129 RepID=UPI001F487289
MPEAIRQQIKEEVIARDGLALRMRGHRARLSDPDQILFERISAVLQDAGMRPPIVGELATTLGME